MLHVGRVAVVACLRGMGGQLHRKARTILLPCRESFLVAPLSGSPQRWGPPEGQEPAVESPGSGESTQGVTDLLQAATSGGTLANAFQSLHTLSDWVSTNKVDFRKDVESEEQFGKLINIIDRGTIRSTPTSLLAALKSLVKMGVSSEAHVMQSIEMQLLWNIRKVSFPVLLSIMLFHVKHQHTDLEKKVLRESVEAIQRRWVEVRRASEVEMLYLHHNLFSTEFLGHLDDRTTELAGDLTYTELAKVFCALGTIQRRATPVIRGLAFHMAKQGEKLPPKLLCSVLYTMYALSFPDLVLLEKVATDLLPQVELIQKPNLIGTILFCIGQLRWRNTRLLESLSEWMEKNASACPTVSLSALIITLATVSYTPANADSLFSIIIPRLTPSSLNKKSAWLDVVWSLVLLGKATEELVATVLDPVFVSSISTVDQQLRMGVRLKLLNINTAAQLTLPAYSGPYLQLADFKDTILTRGREELKLAKHVQAMLYNLLPPPRYLLENLQTPLGIYIDAEFMTDKAAKPLPVQDYSDTFRDPGRGQPTPEGVVKLVLLVWSYRDYTIGSQELLGVNQLAKQLLEKKGYRVLQVPFYEYNIKGKTLKNVQYLEGKIKEVVGSVS